MNRYLLLIRGDAETFNRYTHEQQATALDRYTTWSAGLRARNRLEAAEGLNEETVIVRTDGNRLVVDGPFAETKETFGGYFVVKAESRDEAIEIAKTCPTFNEGGHVILQHIDG